MPKGGSKPGERRGGRQKGTPNRITTELRQGFMRAFENLEGRLEDWIILTAEGREVTQLDKNGNPVTFRTEGDPAKAADLVVRMAEYHVPKLGRQELVGENGAAIHLIINKNSGG